MNGHFLKNIFNSKNKTILITGGTGSLGQALVKRLIKDNSVKEIRIYSRDEYKQSEMARKLNDSKVTYWLGDVRDLERLKQVCDGVDIIIHAAAMKRMDQSSHNTFIVSEVNIKGTRNVMIAGKDCEKVVLVSTDKAYSPSCVYGASKMIAEKITLSYKNGVVWRFGNFKDSRGSVFEIFKEQKRRGLPLTITDPEATRFVIDIEKVCGYVLSNVKPGLYCPKNLKAMTIRQIADSIAPGHPSIIVGLREGEKKDEAFNNDYSSDKCL